MDVVVVVESAKAASLKCLWASTESRTGGSLWRHRPVGAPQPEILTDASATLHWWGWSPAVSVDLATARGVQQRAIGLTARWTTDAQEGYLSFNHHNLCASLQARSLCIPPGDLRAGPRIEIADRPRQL